MSGTEAAGKRFKLAIGWRDHIALAVNNFSAETDLSGSNASVTFAIGGKEIIFPCPTAGTGHWWEVFSYEPRLAKLEVLNRLTDLTW
jgi:hypothetical protein